jgi:glucose-6-phosphate dehydrogenase assembly protein OpcA
MSCSPATGAGGEDREAHVTSPAEIERELAVLRGQNAGDHAGTRTHIVDLVAYADDPKAAAEVGDIVAAMRHHRPSRALIASGGASGEVTAEPAVFCSPMQEGGAVVCCEIVRLTGPPAGDALSSMVASLLLPDLPVFLLWLSPPPLDRPMFHNLAALATRLVTDSTRFPSTLDLLGTVARQEHLVVTDLAWTKVTGWREVVATIFDDAENAALLPSLEHVAIRHVAGSDAQARLLVGWLATACTTAPETRFEAVAMDDMRPGSLIHVELTCGGHRFIVDRPTEGVATVDVPGRPMRRAALRVPPFGTLVGEELEFLAPDRAFEAALDRLPPATR